MAVILLCNIMCHTCLAYSFMRTLQGLSSDNGALSLIGSFVNLLLMIPSQKSSCDVLCITLVVFVTPWLGLNLADYRLPCET